jgi:hypothetical protein
MKEKMNETRADSIYKKAKSELFHIWKKARLLYDMISEERELPDSVKKNITSAYEAIDESIRYIEYEDIFPSKKEDLEQDTDNNFLTNQDKRYPVPVNSESGDQFVTRCILDANMKKRYPVQTDRFQACMQVFNSSRKKPTSGQNPGEKFEDPMEPRSPEVSDPIKPILP